MNGQALDKPEVDPILPKKNTKEGADFAPRQKIGRHERVRKFLDA